MANRKSRTYLRRLIDLTGKRFGHWTVLSYVTRSRWKCQCDCGTILDVIASNLSRGRTKSCGCYKSSLNNSQNQTHGMTGSREYRAWSHAKARCFNPKTTHYRRYGGRGITMCKRWRNSFEAFFQDMGYCPNGFELDRINNNGNYEPENCRWTTRAIQIRNTSATVRITHEGETLTLLEWSEKTGIPIKVLRRRRNRNHLKPPQLFDPWPKGNR